MRITLMHNPKAGDARHSKKELMAALAKAGHDPTYQSTKDRDYKKALKKSTDLMLAAGGDGTAAKVASLLLNSDVPLAILPLGTANNLARSLGFTMSWRDIIVGLKHGKKRSFDVGVARAPWGKRYFFEGAGAGLLADYLQAAKKKPKKISKKQEITQHVSLLRQRLHHYPARKWRIDVDGKNISGDYILWEAMNIRSVGPALFLAPQAATRDGRFDLVCVREEDRFLLMRHLDARLAGEKSKFPLPIRRFRKLNVVCDEAPIHFDDEVWPQEKKSKYPSNIKITVMPSALIILQPASSLRSN